MPRPPQRQQEEEPARCPAPPAGRPSRASHFLDTESDPLAGASSGRLCWAVDVREWEPHDDEFDFLLSLIPHRAERQKVREIQNVQDKKLGLVSRLMSHRACAAVLGHTTFDGLRIERTQWLKPFLKRPRPRWGISGELANFNFNVSHHGPWVVLVSDPVCICGVDVAGPDALFVSSMSSDYLTERERKDAQQVPGNGSAFPEEHVQRLWAFKEAFTKARGDGLRFNMLDCEFHPHLDSSIEDCPGAWRYSASFFIHGRPARSWTSHQLRVDDDHWAAVVRGPTSGVADPSDEFFSTLRRPTDTFSREDWEKVLRRPPPPLSKVPVSFLVPADDFEEYERCVCYGVQSVD